MPEPSIAKPDFSQTLARGLEMLETLSGATGPLSVSQAAERVGISRAASRRLLLTLRELGYVRSDGVRFWLTARVLQLGAGLVRSEGLWSSVAPFVIDLADRLNEPCSISVLDGPDTVFVCRDATRRIFTTRLGVGDRLPANCSASGKTLLACLPASELNRVLALRGLVARTSASITDPARLRIELGLTHERGYGLAIDEMEDGTLSVAVPLRDRDGRVIAAMSLASHRIRRTPVDLQGPLLDELRLAAQQVERVVESFGDRGWVP
ncbi:IclR family transcriptional regulator [Lichenibacterium minor]|uniref:IclR family transcriptional regulator n=1 Tax=Lichenibacterium minor TaxID=2316528 RepID=A0A4Q2U372_9HYPH|nr:IclR family transcriptional regulator C-terminal domain-containing protein [Lichenibacterium minor]RYC30198.1 IclR family transcriptional regulator [Lichenibacterium minor]